MRNWQPVLDCLERSDFAAAIELLDAGLSEQPLNVDGRLLRAIAYASSGSPKRAVHDLWKALAINPASPGTRLALADMFVSGQQPPPVVRNFSLASGERQTASDVAKIREDHRSRYEFAARWISSNIAAACNSTGIDLFCGNGYGSRMLSEIAGCRMVGIDGSDEAVALAEQAFAGARTVFRQAYFPFDIAPGSVDFAVCFESIEHVEDYERFIRTIDQATNGPLIVSFPLEDTLNFSANADLFRYHVRHFTLGQIEDLLRPLNRRIVSTRGQIVYRLKNRRIDGLLPESAMELTALREDSQFVVVVTEKG